VDGNPDGFQMFKTAKKILLNQLEMGGLLALHRPRSIFHMILDQARKHTLLLQKMTLERTKFLLLILDVIPGHLY
jgi:hypothetical protein